MIKQKLNFASVIKKAEHFVSSVRMIPFLGVFTALCHVAGWDLIGFTVLCMVLVFVFLSSAHIRGSVPPFLLALFVISRQNGIADVDAALDGSYYLRNAGFLVFVASVAVCAAVFGIYKRRLKFRVTFGTIGVAFMGLSFILGGMFYDDPLLSPYNRSLAVGSVVALYFLMFFIFFAFVAPSLDFDYIAQAVIMSTLVVLYEQFSHFIRIDAFSAGELRKDVIALGWGISNNIAPMIAMGLPFTAYYMGVSKRPWFFFAIFSWQIVGVVLTLSRAMVLLALPFAVGALIYAVIRAKARQRIILASLTTAAGVLAALFLWIRWDSFIEFISFYIESGFNPRGREGLFEDAWQTFLAHPFLGAGAGYRLGEWDIYLYMAHNTILQFMMWSGMIGLAAIVLHILHGCCLTLYRPKEQRSFLMLAAALLFFHSMLDWMWFFPFALLYYMMFVTKAESDCIEDTGFGLLWEKFKKSPKS